MLPEQGQNKDWTLFRSEQGPVKTTFLKFEVYIFIERFEGLHHQLKAKVWGEHELVAANFEVKLKKK